MHGSEIRRRFLQFFQERDHLLLESAPLVPEDDPSTLFISAGMQPLQPYYRGLRRPPAPRLVSCQRVVRTLDIDEVGRTDRHGTFFEMLGNFAPTGAYFKEAAIALAWEFCLDAEHGLGMAPERLWVTTHPSDDEARRRWHEQGVPDARMVQTADNWWSLGVGPSGPDSELWYDRGSAYACGDAVCYPDHKEGCVRHLEFWNLVFPSFDEQPDGARLPLPHPGIDTGMGLERVSSLLQNVPSMFDIDLVRPILEWVRANASHPGVAVERVLADHLRSMTFIVADGVLPSNEGRGYVLRRLIRHAALEARKAEFRAPLADGVALVVEGLKDQYPYLVEREADVRAAIAAEDEQFGRTLGRGLELFERIAAGAHGGGVVSGDQAFRLHDTEGFPIELTLQLAAERGLKVDRAGFEAAMEAQRERSRTRVVYDWAGLRSLPPSEFIGYEELEGDAEVVLLRAGGQDVEQATEGQEVEVYLDRTPFYGESGGQVGDEGVITTPEATVLVDDAKHPLPGVTAHLGRVGVGQIRKGDRVHAAIAGARRHQIARHHSATHLLNRALEEVLGRRNLQRGSWVGPDHTTFDFPLDRALTEEEQQRVLHRIHEQIRAALPRRVRLLPRDEALATGATHLFEEKYGDVVRVVSFGDWSSEFCGGTHVENSADCGPVAILSETSVGQGLRRIDLTAGVTAEGAIARRRQVSTDLARALGTTFERVPEQVEALRRELREARREVDRLRDELRTQALKRDGRGGGPARRNARVPLILESVQADSMDDLRGWADRYLEFLGGTGVVGVTNDSSFVLKVSRNLLAEVQATRLSPLIGRGGGKPELAQGRLDHPAEEAFRALEEALA